MYVPSEKLIQRMQNDFMFHPAANTIEHGPQHDRYALVRQKCWRLAEELTRLAPESRELSLAITNLEQVMFWTNAAIARNE